MAGTLKEFLRLGLLLSLVDFREGQAAMALSDYGDNGQ